MTGSEQGAVRLLHPAQNKAPQSWENITLDRQDRPNQDPGSGWHRARPAAPHLRRRAARGRQHAPGLLHPEGLNPSPRSPWWLNPSAKDSRPPSTAGCSFNASRRLSQGFTTTDNGLPLTTVLWGNCDKISRFESDFGAFHFSSCRSS